MKKLVIFDCDGVLINTEVIASNVQAKALTAKGFPITTEELIKLCTGAEETATKQLLRDLAPIELSEDFFVTTHSAIAQTVAAEVQALIPNIIEFVASNIPYCIASNSSRGWIVDNLTLTQQMQFFTNANIFNAAQVGKGKPAPDLFLFAAKQMGFLPEECLVIEDSAVGVQAALAANMAVIGFLGAGHAQYPWYKQRLSHYNIPLAHSADELLDVLQEQVGFSNRNVVTA